MKKEMPIRLPVITLVDGKRYFIDRCLKQLRNIFNPHDYIDFKDESELENLDRQAGHQYLPMDVFVDSKTMDEHFHASSIRRRWTKTHQSSS